MGHPARAIAIAALLAAGLAAVEARAEMQVIESDVDTYAVGSRLPDGDLQVPPGRRVRVLLLPSNQTKLFIGPEERAVPAGGTRNPGRVKHKPKE